VNDWLLFFVGLMSVAMAVMAVIQVLVARAVLQASQQMTTAVTDLRKEMRPLIEKAHRIADDASRATALALSQVERVDQLISTATARVDETLSLVQGMVVGPVRHGAAVIAGIRAALTAIGAWQDRRERSREDEDALFVG
jgi:type IV secretory pathway VirB2 component (pilin)